MLLSASVFGFAFTMKFHVYFLCSLYDESIYLTSVSLSHICCSLDHDQLWHCDV